MELNEEQM